MSVHVCKHGQLARQCEACRLDEADARIATLEADNAALRTLAWQQAEIVDVLRWGAAGHDCEHDEMWGEVAKLRAELDRVRAFANRAHAGSMAARNLIDNSAGVYGLHLNGDLSPWSELTGDGRFSEWLEPLDAAPTDAEEAALADCRAELERVRKFARDLWNEAHGIHICAPMACPGCDARRAAARALGLVASAQDADPESAS